MKVRDKTAVRKPIRWRTERNLLILQAIAVGCMIWIVFRMLMRWYT